MLVGRSRGALGVTLVSAFAGCGGSTDNGIGGGGGAPNTCPPTLINYGSGPGIICNEPVGTTCSDAEQFCVCGEQTIEGSPWRCVPTNEGCPPFFSSGTPCNANSPATCDYLADGRTTCTCSSSGIWVCEPSPCGEVYPGAGTCTLDPGETCDFFVPATPSAPDSARNITCTCGANQDWACPPL